MKQKVVILILSGMISIQLSAQSFARVKQDTAISDTAGRNGYAWPVKVRNTCKNYSVSYYFIEDRLPARKQPISTITPTRVARSPLLRIHGNVLYDLNYRSNIDTPYAEKDVYQHTIQTYLDITVKDNYPFRVYFTTRFSNSSLFRNFSDLNLQYNANDFRNRVKRQVQDLIQQRTGIDSLTRLSGLLRNKRKIYDSLQRWTMGASSPQRLIAERETQWLKHYNDSLLKDQYASEPVRIPDPGQLRKHKFGGIPHPGIGALTPHPDSSKQDQVNVTGRLDSLRAELDSLEQRYRALKALQAGTDGQLKREVDGISSGTELKEKLQTLHISDTSLPKGYQTLYSVRSFGIGRTMLDYSELSAKNISITGLQVEYNPSTYMALAAGTVDYRFRDYTMRNPGKGQYIGLIRYGWGKKDGNNVILTYYNGRRQLYNSYTTTQGTEIPNYNLMGFTLEGHYKINRTSSLTAEVAKSSTPYYSLDSTRRHNTLGSALAISDHSNEAWSLKFNTFLPATRTQVNASYRRFGANFQSFSLFTTGSQQTAWSVKIDQPFFRQRLQVTGSIRTNDFTNPLLNAGYKSTTVFKSLQATLRLKKWPTLSIGYFPSSQITKINDSQFQENLFYTFMASSSHTYKVRGISMVGMLMYTQFYNKMTDTNFVYFNTKNLLFSQSAFIGNLTWQSQWTAAMNTTYSLYTIDNKADYKISNWLSLGAGVKYNRQTVYNIDQWGYSGTATVRVPLVGEFRLMADKGFIPGNNRQLVVNKLGRLTYLKVF